MYAFSVHTAWYYYIPITAENSVVICLFWVCLMVRVCTHSVISECSQVFSPSFLSSSQHQFSEGFTLNLKADDLELSSVNGKNQKWNWTSSHCSARWVKQRKSLQRIVLHVAKVILRQGRRNYWVALQWQWTCPCRKPADRQIFSHNFLPLEQEIKQQKTYRKRCSVVLSKINSLQNCFSLIWWGFPLPIFLLNCGNQEE